MICYDGSCESLKQPLAEPLAAQLSSERRLLEMVKVMVEMQFFSRDSSIPARSGPSQECLWGFRYLQRMKEMMPTLVIHKRRTRTSCTRAPIAFQRRSTRALEMEVAAGSACKGDHFSRECPYGWQDQSDKGKGKGSFGGGGKGKSWRPDSGKGSHFFNWQWQRENTSATDQPRDANASGKGSAKGA